MNEIEELDVVIGPTGQVRIEVRGVKGERCLTVTRDLEQRLGIVVERVETDEMRASGVDADATDTVPQRRG